MVKKKKPKDPNKILRTISNFITYDQRTYNVLHFMCHESKNIYNASIFHTQIFYRYHNTIFKNIFDLLNSDKKFDIRNVNDKVYDFYDSYYSHYILIKPFKEYNNKIIYQFIKEYTSYVDLVNNNFDIFKNFFTTYFYKHIYKLKLPDNCNMDTKKELIDDIILSILKSIYNKNFRETKDSILSKKKCRIQDKYFIKQVKNNINLFEDEEKINYKKMVESLLKEAKVSKKYKIKSNQNYISRIVYKYYQNPEIPSDLMCNIITKAFESYSSFLSLRANGIRANRPKFLEKDGMFILPYFIRSRKEVTINGKLYYRLAIGSYIGNNYSKIIDDNRLVCLLNKPNKKIYINKEHLIKIPTGIKIPKKDNYIWNSYYVPKKSNYIIEGTYIFIRKPYNFKDKNLKLIEINPIHNGHKFKINYTYEIKKSNNKPIEGKRISIDLGINNIATIYDPNNEQFIINGRNLINMNNYFNSKIDSNKSKLPKNKKTKKSAKNLLEKRLEEQIRYIEGKSKYPPKRLTEKDEYKKKVNEELNEVKNNKKTGGKHQYSSKYTNLMLTKRKNKIEDYFNKIVKWISEKYKNCEMIIVGYNEGWKKNVNMGKKMNRTFYEIPYRRLIGKLRDKLEENNQRLVVIEESYTSKCDALALEKIGRSKEYLGKRIRRGLFSSSKGVLINADINGAINIMRKWEERNGIVKKEITGKGILNPKKINVYEALSSQ